MAGEKILIIDDEKKICELIHSYLLKEGFASSYVHTGTEAIESIKEDNPDLIILDFMLPDIDGPELCLDIRKITNVPVLFLSCRAGEMDKIVSLSSGGDDYITKPFLPGELIARIKANLRRSRVQEQPSEEDEEIINAGDLVIDPQLRTVTKAGEPVSLTAKEFDILLLLAQNPKRIFSAEQLFKIVWKTTNLNNDPKTVAVHISALRKKISSPDDEYIINIRNIGYKFNHKLLEADN
ncbi:MAG: response regulator transcription factor [Firmicutes bacterium]|nr:response regulator transcription factor [Bacillota bacterium]